MNATESAVKSELILIFCDGIFACNTANITL